MEENSKKLKIAWLHNYDTQKNPSSGIFMYQLFNALKANQSIIQIDLISIGNINNPLIALVKFFRYRKLFNMYDFLHAQYGSGTGFFTSLFKNKKIISLRGSDWYHSPSVSIKEKLHIWLGCKLTRVSLYRYNKVIVMSERMRADVKCDFKNLEIDIIPDGLDLKKFYPKPIDSDSVFRILFSSIDRRNPVKRFELANNAFSIFKAKHPNSELVFMSGVSHDKVNDFINGVDVILLTSTHEGWPNIIKEGLACNVPFIATDVSDLRGIANKTKTCFICEDKVESIVEHLEILYKNKRKEDLNKIACEFDIEKISKKLLCLYKETN